MKYILRTLIALSSIALLITIAYYLIKSSGDPKNILDWVMGLLLSGVILLLSVVIIHGIIKYIKTGEI